MKLKICEYFESCQGEGRYAGEPAMFIRLSGCSRNCDFCDTKYHTTYKLMEVSTVVGIIKRSSKQIIVYSGGEPLVHRNQIFRIIEKIEHETDNYKKGYLLGVRKGDGYIGYHRQKRSNREYRYEVFNLQCKDFEMICRFRDYVHNLFGTKYAINKRKSKWTYKGTVFEKNYLNIAVYSPNVVRFLKGEPKNKEQKRGFVAGFFDSEGSVRYGNWGPDLVVYQKDRSLLNKFIKYANEFGFRFSTHDNKKSTGVYLAYLLGGKNEAGQFYKVFNPGIIRKFRDIENIEEKKWHCEVNGDLLGESDFLKFDYIAISPKDIITAKKIAVLIKKYNIEKYKYDVKVVTDLDKVGVDMIPYATMLMPLTTYSKKDLEIKKKVWNYCNLHYLQYSPRLHVDLFGKRRGV